jgi:hypothetical protein
VFDTGCSCLDVAFGGAEFELFYPVGNGLSASVFYDFCFCFDWVRRHHSSLSILSMLQAAASALKVALRFRHLWFICLIWKYWISRVFVVDIGCSCLDVAFGRADFDLSYPSGNSSSASVSFDFVFGFDWGRCHHSSLSIPHTLQGTASALKVALRFRHLWFICLIWKY